MDRLDYLRQRFFDNTATPAEREELYQLLKNVDPETSEFFKSLEEQLKSEVASTPEEQHRLSVILNQLERKIRTGKRGKLIELPGEDGRKHRVLPLFLRVAASLLLIAVVGYGAFKYMQSDEIISNTPVAQDIKAGGDKAVLQLADGTQVELNGKGTAIPQQGVAQIVNASGKLSYSATDLSAEASAKAEIIYNTVSTPRGGQYQLTLADGSNVWLNAASSLKFPAVFSGNERVVELTGEAYFEIAKNAKMAFKVRIPSGAEVEVLGTHFNVMAYAEEDAIKTTLLEGSVRITKGANSSLLAPNQQAQITKQGNLSVIKNSDVTEAVAWKNSKFIFNDTPLSEIMRQLSRWYDVEVIFEDDVRSMRFGAVISRKENASAILDILEMTGGVDFEIRGKNIIVRNAKH